MAGNRNPDIISLDAEFGKPVTSPDVIELPSPATKESPGAAGFEARVQDYYPQASKEVFQKGPASVAGQTIASSLQNMPVVGPLGRMASTAFSTGVLGKGEGKDFGERYTNQYAYDEAVKRALEQQYPKSHIASEVGAGLTGALLTPELGISKAISGGITDATKSIAPKLAPYLEKFAPFVGKTVEAGTWGGLTALPEKKPGETLQETAERVGVGTLLGAAAPTVVAGAKKLFSPTIKIAESIIDPKTAVLRELQQNAQKSTKYKGSISPEEYARRWSQGEPAEISDIKGAAEKIGAAAATSSDNRLETLNDRLRNRFEKNSNQISNSVDNAFGMPIDAYNRRLQSDQLARSTNKPAYDAAYNHPDAQNIWNPTIQTTLNTKEGKLALDWAENEANKVSTSTRTPPPENPFRVNDNGQVEFKPGKTGASLEFLDYVKRGLNNVYAEQSKAGGTTSFNTNDMIKNYTKSLTDTVKPYGDALSNSGKFIRGNNAFEAGTNLIDLLPVSGGNKTPGELTKQIAIFNKPAPAAGQPSIGQYMTKDEKELFQQGVGAWVKENPSAAAAIFKGGTPEAYESQQVLKKVLGNQTYNQIDRSMQVTRTTELLREIKENPGLVRRLGLSPAGAGFGAGAIGTGAITAAQTYLPKVMEMIQNNPLGMVGAGITGLSGVQAIGSRLSAGRRMDALLDMASSSDPEVARNAANTITKLATGDDQWGKALQKIENTLSLALAQHHLSEPYVPGVGPTNMEKRREGRASGGRISTSSLGDKLVLAAERAKKENSKATEPLLNVNDESIAKALEIANRNL